MTTKHCISKYKETTNNWMNVQAPEGGGELKIGDQMSLLHQLGTSAEDPRQEKIQLNYYKKNHAAA